MTGQIGLFHAEPRAVAEAPTPPPPRSAAGVPDGWCARCGGRGLGGMCFFSDADFWAHCRAEYDARVAWHRARGLA